MKAIVYTRYGPPDVLQLKEVEKPAPKDNEVLIKVHASTVTPIDLRFRQGKNIIARMLAGLTKPKNSIFGVELAEALKVQRDKTLPRQVCRAPKPTLTSCLYFLPRGRRDYFLYLNRLQDSPSLV